MNSLEITKKHHKIAAELLKKAYLDPKEFVAYQKIEALLNLEKIPYSIEALADRYHYHLKIAVISLKEHHFLPNVKHLDTLSSVDFLPIDIYLDNLRSCHNVGSILRTCEAFRLGHIHFSEKTPFIDHEKLKKSAMGTESLVPSFQNTPLHALRKPLIALETTKDAISLYDFSFPTSFSLLIGNEEYGLSEQALNQADIVIKIPLVGFKNSLNVANAFAITASEIKRQLHFKSI